MHDPSSIFRSDTELKIEEKCICTSVDISSGGVQLSHTFTRQHEWRVRNGEIQSCERVEEEENRRERKMHSSDRVRELGRTSGETGEKPDL
ncbi:hypothetical protein R3I94_008617 [Phoxinus phoxinus]